MLSAESYARRGVNRSMPTYYTRTLRAQIEASVEWAWLRRRWAEDGAGRPLLLRIMHDAEHVWVVENKAKNERRVPGVCTNPHLVAYQVNQATGRWTQTRSRYVYALMITEILPVTAPVVRKARAWAVSQRLQRGEGTQCA